MGKSRTASGVCFVITGLCCCLAAQKTQGRAQVNLASPAICWWKLFVLQRSSCWPNPAPGPHSLQAFPKSVAQSAPCQVVQRKILGGRSGPGWPQAGLFLHPSSKCSGCNTSSLGCLGAFEGKYKFSPFLAVRHHPTAQAGLHGGVGVAAPHPPKTSSPAEN